MRSPATSVDERAQPARIAVGLALVQRPRLDLADALAGDTEALSDLLQRAWLLTAEPEAQLEHLALAVGQLGEDTSSGAASPATGS
jgi:hypothetical protein